MRFSKVISLSFLLIILLMTYEINAQAILDANGPGKTYELINSILAPLTNPAEEAPDMTNGTHASFGRHIAEVWDSTLNKYVFEFYIHPAIDNDISTLDTNKQRVEIKTYAPSPDSMKGIVGDLMTFKWKFRLPQGFQPSPYFTHIHQIKGVNGDDGDPIFTITPVILNGKNKLQLRYVADSTQGNSNNPFTSLTTANLSDFQGMWVQVTEVIRFDTTTKGNYSIKITKVGDTTSLLRYSSNAIKTMRVSNSFVRPKWGIYRSVLTRSYLRDDSLRLSGITIYKGKTALPVNVVSFNSSLSNNIVSVEWKVEDEVNVKQYVLEYSAFNSNEFIEIYTCNANGFSNYYYNFKNPCEGDQYYRLKVINQDGTSFYSHNVVKINHNVKYFVFPNPASGFITIFTDKMDKDTYYSLIDESGKTLNYNLITNNTTNLSTVKLKNGLYYIQLIQNKQVIHNYPVIIKN